MVTVVYSGSFNPLHTGHAILASWVTQYCPEVEEVWLIVTPCNPLKDTNPGATDADRLAMASLVAEKIPGVLASDFEFSLPRPTYTYSTLKALAHRWPERDFRLLIGSDNWHIFHKWKDYDLILKEFGVYIYTRPGFHVEPENLPPGAKLLTGAPQIELSSTFIRDGIAKGNDMNYFLPEPVYDYVRSHGLYAKSKIN